MLRTIALFFAFALVGVLPISAFEVISVPEDVNAVDLTGAAAQTIYIDDQLARERMLGIIDIYWETAQDTAPADGQVYRIQFRKR